MNSTQRVKSIAFLLPEKIQKDKPVPPVEAKEEVYERLLAVPQFPMKINFRLACWKSSRPYERKGIGLEWSSEISGRGANPLAQIFRR